MRRRIILSTYPDLRGRSSALRQLFAFPMPKSIQRLRSPNRTHRIRWERNLHNLRISFMSENLNGCGVGRKVFGILDRQMFSLEKTQKDYIRD